MYIICPLSYNGFTHFLKLLEIQYTQKYRSKKYVIKHKKCRKNLVGTGKRYNFALAFGKQATAAAGVMPGSDNIRQAKSETEKKTSEKIWRFEKSVVTLQTISAGWPDGKTEHIETITIDIKSSTREH